MSDIIDKIFSRLQKRQAPKSLVAKVLDIPEASKSGDSFLWFKKLVLPFAVLVIVLGAGFYYYQNYLVHNIASAFELIAQDMDSAGVSPESVFILKSSKNISAVQVKKIIKINPEVDFEVKDLGGNRFQIKPLLKLSGNTIYQVSIEEGVAERDYSWAFQIKAPFATISTFPRHQSTGVPTNSSIEATFNRENLKNAKESFSISPKVEGRFEIKNDTIVFLPAKPLQNQTVYTVTIKKGLSAEGTDQPLAEDLTFAFETEPVSYNNYTSFDFSQGISYFDPGKEPSLSVYSYNLDFSSAEANLYSFKSKDDFIEKYYQSRNWDLGWTYYYRNSQVLDTSSLTKVASFKPQLTTVDYQSFINVPQKLSEGYYLLDIKVGGQNRQAWILVNNISHYYSLTDSNGLVWAYDFASKSPINNASIGYYDQNGQHHDLAKTGSDGLSEFVVPDIFNQKNSYDADYGKPKFLEIAPSGKPATLVLVSAGWWYYGPSSAAKTDFWSYLSTDRFTYKLTDKVQFWGVVKGKAQDYKNQKVKIQIREGYYYEPYYMPGYDNQDRPLAETEATISNFDTISGHIDYQGLKAGTYQILVLLNDKVVTQTSLEILDYVKPAYKISVTPNKNSVFAGQPVEFNVEAKFYDGTPVGSLNFNYSGYDGSRQLTGKVTTNSKGQGKLTITPQYQAVGYYPSSLYLSFVPEAVEEADINSEYGASVLVFGPKVYIQSSYTYSGDYNYSIKAKTNEIVLESGLDSRGENSNYWDYIGSAVAGANLQALVEKMENLQIEDGVYYDPITKTSLPKYRYEERKTIFGTYDGSTDSNGEWVFNVNLPQQERVYYNIKISGKDQNGRVYISQLYPYFYQTSDYQNNADNLVLSLNFEGGNGSAYGYDYSYSKDFSIGEKVSMSLQAESGKQHLTGKTLFYRYGRDGIGKVSLKDDLKFEENFDDGFRPAASYKAVVFGPFGFVESNSIMANYQQSDADLNIEIKPDKESYKPGDTAKVSVNVKNKNGQASIGELNLSVVDEAVFDVLPYYWQQDILQSLYEIDYSDPVVGLSDFTPAGLKNANGGAEGGGCFLPGTKILMADGSYKNIEDIKVGDLVLTRVTESDAKNLQFSIVQGISSHVVGDYLIFNNNLKVTGEHKLYVNGQWLEAGKIKVGDKLSGENGEEIKVESIKKVLAPKTMVYNFNAGKYHTYFAGGVFAHNAEKGGGYRSEFLDTASFQNKNLSGGKAEFEFKIPDNITSWRVTATTFDGGKIFAGQKSELLPVSLPFFVDAVTSNTYLSLDKPVITVRAYGANYNSSQNTVFNLDIDALGIHETQTIKNGQTDFALPSLPVGDYELKIKGKQGNLEDGIVKKFKVVNSYFTSSSQNSVSLSSGLKGINFNDPGYLDVSFVDEGKALFYDQLKAAEHSYGKRSDQAAAAYFAKLMLKQYFGENKEIDSIDLSAYQVPEEGLALFTYGDSDLELSAMISDLLPDYVYQNQLQAYFKNASKDQNADLSRISKALYGLSVLKQPVLTKLQLIKNEPDLTLEDKVYVALGMARLGDKENARSYYLTQIAPELHREGGQAWVESESNQTKRVKQTALIGTLSSAIGEFKDTDLIWKYLNQNRPEDDLDLLERMMIVRDGIAKKSSEQASFKFTVNGKTEEVKLENGQGKTIKFSKAERDSIEFKDVKGKVSALAITETGADPDSLNKNSQLSIKRSFWVGGKQTTNFKEGDTVIVKLEFQIATKALAGAYQIVDFVPSGLRPVSNLWQRGLASNYMECSQKIAPITIDGNKVYFPSYNYNSKNCSTYTIEYYARVASKGEFTASPPLIQSINNFESLNIGDKQKIIIK